MSGSWHDDKKAQAKERMQVLEQTQRAVKKQGKRLGDVPKTAKAPAVGEWAVEPETTTTTLPSIPGQQDPSATTTTTRNIDEILAAARRGGRAKVKKPTIVVADRAKRLESLTTASAAPAPPASATADTPSERPVMTPPSPLPPYYQSLASPIRRFVAEGEAAGQPGEKSTFFPIEFFDDTTLETRTPDQWLRGSRRARSKWYETDGTWRWEPCTVVSHDPVDDKYTIEWDTASKSRKKVSRLNLRFEGEDPERLARRIESAVRSRFFYERLALRQTRLDMKDLTGLPDLPAACVRRVLALAGMPSSAAQQQQPAQRQARVRDLVEEVRLGYRKLNKQLEFDHRHPIEEELEPFMLPMVAALRPKRPPRTGTIADCQAPAFAESLAAVAAGLPSSHRRIHAALLALWAALADLRERRLLLADAAVSDVEQFRSAQAQCFQGAIEAVKKEVEPIMVGFVMQASNEEERDKADKAGVPRFKKLVRVANLCLKDTIKDIALSSIDTYAERFESYEHALAALKEAPQSQAPSSVATAAAIATATAAPSGAGSSAQAPAPTAPAIVVPRWVMLRVVYPPLFRLNLVVEAGGKIGFSPALAEFQAASTGTIQDMFAALRTIPPIDVATVEYHHFEESLITVPADEPAAVAASGRVTRALKQNFTSLTVFRDSLREFEAVLATNVEEQLSAFAQRSTAKGAGAGAGAVAAGGNTLIGIKFEIEKAARQQLSASRKIEDSVAIGIFEVDCTRIKAAVIETSGRLQKAFLGVLHAQAKAELGELVAVFQAMQARLSKKPETPVELVDVTGFVDKVTAELPELIQRISNLGKKYQLFEDSGYDVSQEEFDTRWQVVGWPRSIRQTIFSIEKTNSIERLHMIRDLRNSQKLLEEKIFKLDGLTREVDQYRELEQAFAVGDRVRQLQGELLEALEQAKVFDNHERLFGFKPSESLATIQKLVHDFDAQFKLWSTASSWVIQETAWLASPFTSLNAAAMLQAVATSRRVVAALIKKFRGAKENAFNVASRLRDKIEAFRAVMPLVSKLRHPGVRRRHWEAISAELHFDLPTAEETEQFTLGKVLALELGKHQDVIGKITDVAINEHTLESALEKMNSELRAFVFELSPYKTTGTSVVHSTDDLSDVVEDQWVRLQTMLTSPYIDAFVQRANAWKATLENIRGILAALLQCQKNWMYLFPILTCSDIRNELPTESRKFQAVDATWRKIVAGIAANPKVLNVCSAETTLLKQLDDCNRALESVHSSLNEFLETKRARFNRFYFLSNDELLDILAHSKDPSAVQVHCPKLFENILALELGPASESQSPEARGMASAEDERVPFSDAVSTSSKEVEVWLLEVESSMRKTLQKLLTKAVASYGKVPRDAWLSSSPAQVVLTANQVLFTQQVTRVLGSDTSSEIKSLRTKVIEDIADYTNRVRGDVTPAMRCTITALMTLLVHNRDVVNTLAKLDDPDLNVLEWVSQLRYYLEDESLVIRILQTEFKYGYEYLGNTSRLVLTPLTDRVYHTLSNALNMCYGGSLLGPAGTGKTETVRDLARALGRMAIVVNCSNSMDYLAVAKVLKGGATTGCFVCFDEFNRIDVGVLSVIASQVLSIQQAIAAQAPKFRFAGSTAELPLDQSCAIHVTMNPGYGGRSELPDNLKALLRPVSMTVADATFVAETLLFCEGFQDASDLARKLTRCLSLCAEQLSSQSHYDFGMRSVKTTLAVAGASKRRSPLRPESLLLVDALRRCNEPKLLAADLPLFSAIISDLFPQLPAEEAAEDPAASALAAAAAEEARKLGLEPTAEFMAKCLQLYETMRSRHGVMLVGDAASGKTSCYRTLARALNAVASAAPAGTAQKRVEIHVISPKAITMDQLFGWTTPTFEWVEGIIPKLVKVSAANAAAWHWLVFDGPVDSLWAETLNSVLDNTKILCLTNGERIAIPGNLTILFEVTDLKVASPATVSRCGMVYVDSAVLGLAPLAASWIRALPPGLKPVEQTVRKLAEAFLPALLARTNESCRRAVDMCPVGITRNLFGLVDCFVSRLFMTAEADATSAAAAAKPGDGEEEQEEEEAAGEAKKGKGERPSSAKSMHRTASMADMEGEGHATLWSDHAEELEEMSRGGEASMDLREVALQAAFAFSAVHTVGCALAADSRAAFDGIVRRTMQEFSLEPPFPGAHPVTQFYYSFADRAWRWFGDLPEVAENRVNAFAPIDAAPVFTADVACRMYLMEALVTSGRNVFVVGERAAGKTLEATHFLFNVIDQHENIPVAIPLSRFVTSEALRERLASILEKKKKASGALGPPEGKTVVALLDDANTPAAEASGAQPPIELLRCLLDHSGWHEATAKDVTEVRRVTGMQFVATATIDDACPINRRLLRHFSVVYHGAPWEETLPAVLGRILQAHAARYGAAVAPMHQQLADATVGVLRAVCDALRPTVTSPHYLWTPGDAFRVVRGVLAAPVGQPQFAQPADFVRLWLHESQRVFGDRLNSDTDREALRGILLAQAARHLAAAGWDPAREPAIPLFGEAGAPYGEISDPARLFDAVQSQLSDYNAGAKSPMELHIFAEAVEHVLRVSRVLRSAAGGGHALLLGMSGSGRQSLSRLAASMAEAEVFELAKVRHYGLTEWGDDLRRAINAAGLQQRNVALLLRADSLPSEFLADVAELMHTGVVSRAYTREDRQSINLTLRALETRETLARMPANTTEHMFDRFAARARANLHVVVCMSPYSRSFRELVRLFPDLVASAACVDWFGPWTSDALGVIGRASLASFDLGDGVSPDDVARACVAVHAATEAVASRFEHEERRPSLVPSSKFLDFIRLFKSLLGSRRGDLTEQSKRLEGGIGKLNEAATVAARDQAMLEELLPVLERTSREEAELLAKLNASRDEASAMRDRLQVQEKEQSAEAEVAAQLQQGAEAALQQALPTLNAAKDALSKLSRQEINEIKSLANPPATMTLIMKGMCILFQRKPRLVQKEGGGGTEEDYWPEARALMDANFLQRLLTFDTETITDDVIAKLRPLLAHQQFQPAAVERVNVSLKSLAGWIRAMDRYYAVSKSVAPKRKKLEEANARLREGLERLEASRKLLRDTEDRISALVARAKEAEDKRRELQRQQQEGQLRLDRANRLLFYLGSERQRWEQGVGDFARKLSSSIGDSLLAAACITYLGPFPASYRVGALAQWREALAAVPALAHRHSPDFTLVGAMGDPIRAREWRLQALPSDSQSLESALIATAPDTPPPLLVDPQGQALRWLLNMEQARGVQMVAPSAPSFVSALESCVQFGKPLVIPGVADEIDPALAPLLARDRQVVDSQPVVQLGDHVVQYNSKFRLYLVTPNAVPRLTPEALAQVNVINFSVTREGLEEQFLARVVGHEKRELETQRTGLLEAITRHNKQLHELESRILWMLQSAKGDILSDETLIDALSSSKKASDEVALQLAEAERVGAGIEDARARYAPLAKHTATLFSAVSELSTADPMYQFSLEWFAELLEGVMNDLPQPPPAEASKPEVVDRRVADLSERLTSVAFRTICRSIFEQHKPVFSLLLAARIAQTRGRLSASEWAFFVTGTTPQPAAASQQLERPGWTPEAQWAAICALSRLPAFAGLAQSFVSGASEWKKLFFAAGSEAAVKGKEEGDEGAEPSPSPLEQRRRWVSGPLPGGWGEKLGAFGRLLLVRAARLDALSDAAEACVSEVLGPAFLDPPRGFDIEDAFARATPQKPILLVLAPGADPAAEIFEFAEKRDMAKRVTNIALGSADVGPVAVRAVHLAIDRGDWVLLQNAHLAASWLPELERLVREIPPDRVHEKFRLWLTSRPTPLFPVSVLQTAVKATYERPAGVRASLARSYSQRIDASRLRDPVRPGSSAELWHKLVYGACWLHATVVERSRFGALGWNKPYAFTDGDLSITLSLLDYVSDSTSSSSSSSSSPSSSDEPATSLRLLHIIRYIAIECVYGGHITEAADRRLLDALADDVYTPAIFDQDHALSESGRYVVPAAGTRDEYLAAIRSLPLADDPEVFGLHENAAIACAQKEARSIVDALSAGLDLPSTLPAAGSGAADAVEAKAVLARIPEPFDEAAVAAARPPAQEGTLNAVLAREVSLYNRLLGRMRSSLRELISALAGLVPFSPELEALHRDIGIGVVPELWRRVGYLVASPPLVVWLGDLLKRVAWIRGWVAEGEPSVFWVGGLFAPQAFLTGVLQRYARKLSIPLDRVTFSAEVAGSRARASADDQADSCCVSITGLALQGARWNSSTGQLEESLPNELFCELPRVKLRPREDRSIGATGGDGGGRSKREARGYRCPVYQTLDRTGPVNTSGQSVNVVTHITLPTDTAEYHWIKRGTALFCQVNS